MAPPGNRRKATSRKAQTNLFTGYILAGLGALIGAVLIIISLWQPSFMSGPRGEARDASATVGETSAFLRAKSNRLFATIVGYLDAGSQNADLKKEVELARIKLEEIRAVEQENERLRGLLELSTEQVQPVVNGRLIGSSAASSRQFGYLGLGTNDGVTTGMPVRSERGVVGRILEVSDNSARVLFLTDSESILPVRRAKDDVVAFARGRGDGTVRIRLINLGINPLEKGDLFVTSGSGGYYQPGMAVALVTEVSDDGADARLISDPAATDFVSVLPVFEPELVEVAETPEDQAIAPAPALSPPPSSAEPSVPAAGNSAAATP
jgi:rod shape-determining protein MreC